MTGNLISYFQHCLEFGGEKIQDTTYLNKTDWPKPNLR